MLGIVLVGVGFAFDLCYVLLAGRLAAWLSTSPRAARAQRLGFATVFGLAALRLAVREG